MLTTLVFGLGLLTLLDTTQLPNSLRFILDSAVGLAPFILVSTVFVGMLTASGIEGVTARVFRNATLPMIFLASAFGALSPLCSCGVIPVILGLLVAGVPLAPVMAFWIASPIMDPEMFVLLAGGISFHFAIAKTIIAFGMGLVSGLITHLLEARGYLANPLNAAARAASGGCNSVPAEGKIAWTFWQQPERRAQFQSSFLSALKLISVSLGFAFFLESLMVTYVPADTMAAFVQGDSIGAIFKAILIGIPVYLNGYAAIPLVDRLMEFGMLPGVAMAFMIGGSVTSIPAIIAVASITRKPVFLWYLSAALISTLSLSLAYQWVLNSF